jgi:hypothetical protein
MQQINNNSPLFPFSLLVRLNRMVKRRAANPYVRKKNQPIPNRLYNTQNHRPNNEGTMSMPAIAVAADSEPTPPPTRMIVDNSIADHAFDFGNFDCDVDDGVVDEGGVVDPKRQRHDGLLSVNTTMTIAGTASSYNLDANEAQQILDTTLNETLVTTGIAATHDALSDPLSAAEARAMQIIEKKKTTKFKGKSDMEMKRIRMNNVLSKGHTKTKETSIDKMYTYLSSNEDLSDLADWIAMPNRFIPRQRRLIVLTTGPRCPSKHEIWNEVLLCIAVNLRMDDAGLDRSTAVNAQKPKHLRVPEDYDYEPNSIKKFFKCVFAYATQLGVQYSGNDFRDGKCMC